VRERTEAAAIGAFVIGAIALVFAAVVIWGSGRLFRETAKYVCYFDGSVEGLEVGAPVKVRGVAVGRVVRIQLRYRQRPTDDRIPVFVEVDLKRIVGLGADRTEPEVLRQLIARGARARLETQSLVTGTSFVNFGNFPGTPVVLSELEPEGGYPEIPTVPKQLAQVGESVTAIVSQLRSVDFVGMTKAFAGAASSIERLAGADGAGKALDEIAATLRSWRKIGRDIDTDLPPLLADLRLGVGDARKTLVGLDGAAGAASRLVAPEASLSVRLGDALGEVTRAADAVRDLAEYLERNPNALLLGKSK
jgi:paraquat-inducible protein B